MTGSESSVGRARAAITYVLVLLGLITFSAVVGSRSFQPKTFDFDLVAFYCGGAATAHSSDPYRVEPLRHCEHAVGSVFQAKSPLVVPDPLPPYDQAGFSVLSHLPYRDVQWLWFIVELGAFLGAVWLLSEICGLPRLVVACSLMVSEFYCSGILGQIVPVCLFGIVLAGWALERKNYWVLTIALILAMVEPHIGVPGLLSVLIWGGRVRSSAILAAAALATISVIALPLDTIGEYFTTVIPAHALSEINNQEQLSLAYPLHLIGVPSGRALLLAKIEYGAMLCLGLFLARGAATRFGRPMLLWAPTVFVLLGGPFMHVTQVVAAIPAALLVVGRAKSNTAAYAVAILSVPWINYADVLTVIPFAAAALYVILRQVCGLDVRRGMGLVFAGCAFVVVSAFYVALHVTHAHPMYGNVLGTSIAEGTWKTIVDSDRHGYRLLSAIAKLPTILALLMIVAAMVKSDERIRSKHEAARPPSTRERSVIGRRSGWSSRPGTLQSATSSRV